MPTELSRISSEESRQFARRRKRMNWLVFVLLAGFVAAVFYLSFSHIRTETSAPQSAAEPK